MSYANDFPIIVEMWHSWVVSCPKWNTHLALPAWQGHTRMTSAPQTSTARTRPRMALIGIESLSWSISMVLIHKFVILAIIDRLSVTQVFHMEVTDLRRWGCGKCWAPALWRPPSVMLLPVFQVKHRWCQIQRATKATLPTVICHSPSSWWPGTQNTDPS